MKNGLHNIVYPISFIKMYFESVKEFEWLDLLYILISPFVYIIIFPFVFIYCIVIWIVVKIKTKISGDI